MRRHQEKNQGKSTVVHLDESTHADLEAYCRANNLSMSTFVSGLIEDAVLESPRVVPVSSLPKNRID